MTTYTAEQLIEIVKPLGTARYEVEYQWPYLKKMISELKRDYGGLELNPDFQRGHVWLPKQQQHFIENVLRGVVSSSGLLIQFNCPNFDDYFYQGELPLGFQCIDGLQRLTAIFDFLDGKVKPFGLNVTDLNKTAFSPNKFRIRLAVHTFMNRVELLQHYLALNAGGTPHSAAEIDRVMALLDLAKERPINN